MAKDLRAAVVEREERARALVASRAYVVTAGAVLVYADTAGCPGYTVEWGRCPCPDATKGYAHRALFGRCKHVVAAELVGLSARRATAARRLARIADEFAC